MNELWTEIGLWIASTGVENLAAHPGIWHGKTERLGAIGPLDVRINPHTEVIDNIPPFNIRIGMDDYFPGIIGIIGPDGGMLISSPKPGEDETGLIEHFRNQPSRKAE